MGYVSDRQPSIQSELQALLPRLHNFAAALTGARHASLDLTRAVCHIVLTRAHREKGQTQLSLWALTEMHTLWMTRLAARVKPRREDPAEPELFYGAFEANNGGPATAQLAKFIAHLPAQQRGALTLVYGLGLSYDEAAEVYGVHVSTIMTRLVRCHKALSRWMEHRGLGAAPDAAPSIQHPVRRVYAHDYEEQAA
ncbi:MAG: RNA polymerase sigma factor [Chitinophagales bacterium]|nr:RNA polymerase sigma factor [Hyphomicrobiales bacterium]